MASGKPVGSFYVQLGLNTKDFRKNLQGAKRDLRSAFGSAAIQTSQNLAASMTILAGAALAVAGASVKLAANLEVQTKAFGRLLGSSKAARTELEYLQKFAADTPFTFTELVAYEKRMLALGFTTKETRSLLTTLGDAASGLGLDGSGMGRLIKAFGDIRAKGVLATQEIKQLAETGIPAFEILAKKIGVSIPEAMKLVETRSIDSATAIAAFTEGINDKFGGMMAIQAETMIGMFSTVRDETENIMRIIGKNITESLDLSGVVKKIRDALKGLRTEIQNKGLVKGFTGLFGSEMKIAIIAISGAIVGMLIPAVISLGASLTLALAPLAPLIAAGFLIGGIVGIAKAIKDLKDETNELAISTEKANKALAKTLSHAGHVQNRNEISKIQEKLAYLRTEKDIQKELTAEQEKATIARYNSSNSGYTSMGKAGKEGSQKRINALIEEKKAVIDLNSQLSKLKDIYRKQVKLSDGTYVEAFSSGRKLARSVYNGLVSFNLKAKLGEYLPNLMGVQADKPDVKPDVTPTTKTVNPLIEEAKRTTATIERQWINQTKTKQEQLDYQFKNEKENLNRSKAFNKNYQQDAFRLSEVYSQKGRELIEAEFIDKQNYFDMQEQQEYAYLEARDNAYYESFKNKQNGWELEQQLMQDMNAADLEAFIAHLDEKAVAERAALEGRREVADFYNELQREANRSNLSYLTEGYQTFYSGMTNALVDGLGSVNKLGEALKQLGTDMISMIVRQMIQRKLSFALSESLKAASTATSVAQAAIIAAAWVAPAALVNMATFGSSAGAAKGMMAFAGGFSPIPIPGLAEGGIVTKPTLIMAGEGGEAEGVFPLSKLKSMNMGGSGAVQVNVINQTSQPVQSRSQTRFDGARTVIDLFIEGVNRNISGVQDVIGGR